MRASKRARHDLAFTPFLSNLTIFVPLEGSGIAHLRTKLAAWKRSVPSAGGILTQDPTTPSITHVLVETLPCNAENLPHHPFPVPSTHTERTTPVAKVGGSDSDSLAGSEPVLVAPSWLEQSLLHRKREPEHQHRPQRHPPGTPGSSLPAGSQHEKQEASGGEEVPPLEAKRRRRWLGEANWRPECATMTQTELVLYGVYNVKRSEKIGNEPVVAALKELSRYERALAEEHTEDDETGEEKMNHRALRYARAAAVVRGCAFRIMPGLEAGELPFVGPATADQINAILSTGTCAALECFRRDLEVTDSRGVRRRGTDGAATRAKFASLPGVAARTASRWWYAGLRSFEDVEHAAQPGGLLSADGAFPLSVEQAFSLRHRKDLLEPVPPQDIDEVMETVLQTLGQVSFPGWSVSLAGGGRRGAAAHDVDLLATHPSECIEVLPETGESIVSLLVARLIADGKMVDAHTAMCRVQQGLMGSHIEHIKQEHAKEESDAPGRQTLDRFDHIYGVFCTSRGKYRRFDVIFIPQEEYGFGELGWIGSRTFLRFQRQHAKELGMYLNSHGLFVKQAHGSRLVPQEGPPKRKDGSESWPPGWSEDRCVRSEKDVFDLLEMPYRPPEDREAL